MTTPDPIPAETLAEWSEDANRGDITDARWGTGTHARDRRILALCAEVERLTRERDEWKVRAVAAEKSARRLADEANKHVARAAQAEQERDEALARWTDDETGQNIVEANASLGSALIEARAEVRRLRKSLDGGDERG